MSFFRSLPVIVSLAGSALLLAFTLSFSAGDVSDGYAALVCAETVPDDEILRRLERNGISGVISESGTWAFLDCFGSVERIPLDEYAKRVLPFDPRNDGYAEKLRSLFVRDGKRRLYIPFRFTAAALERTLAAAMTGISWSLEYSRGPGPELFYLLLFLLASGAFFIRPLRPVLRDRAARLLPLLPPLLPLAVCGAPGFAMAALLGGFGVLLLDLILGDQSRPAGKKALPMAAAVSAATPVTEKLLPAALAAAYGIIAFFSGSGLFAAVFVPLLFCGVLALLIAAGMKNGAALFMAAPAPAGKLSASHSRFSPVPIIGVRAVNPGFALVMTPYAAAAILLVLAGIAGLKLPLSLPAARPPLPDDLVTEADYLDHYTFQAGFSFRSLNAVERSDDLPPGSMPGYAAGKDELPLPNPQANFSPQPEDIPPFPVADLVADFENNDPLPENTAAGSGAVNALSGSSAVHILSALLPAVFAVPVLVRRKAAGKVKLRRRGKGG